VLLALAALPLLVWAYGDHQRRRAAAASEFAREELMPSVAPVRPGRRRHVPMLVFALAAVILVVAAARPQHSVAVPLTDGAVMLVDDVSASMASTDVHPSRLQAAARAAARFLTTLPAQVRAGLITFNDNPTVRQSPTPEHQLVRQALTGGKAGGHTAIGTALEAAIKILTGLRAENGKRPPGAIVLISDGTSTTGADPRTAARHAAAAHIPVYTVAVGTARGTIPGSHGPNPVPVDPSELTQIASLAHGQVFAAGDASKLNTVYAHLAARIGHRNVNREITSGFAGAGLLLLLAGGGLSLAWFQRFV
jgi:Ca-activated chloride channel family protein